MCYVLLAAVFHKLWAITEEKKSMPWIWHRNLRSVFFAALFHFDIERRQFNISTYGGFFGWLSVIRWDICKYVRRHAWWETLREQKTGVVLVWREVGLALICDARQIIHIHRIVNKFLSVVLIGSICVGVYAVLFINFPDFLSVSLFLFLSPSLSSCHDHSSLSLQFNAKWNASEILHCNSIHPYGTIGAGKCVDGDV